MINTYLLQSAWSNIRAAKLRSGLAVLGILVGSASIVALISCGQLATASALAQFKALGTNLVSVNVYRNDRNHHQAPRMISLQRWQQLPYQVSGVAAVSPYSTAFPTISYQGLPIDATIIGVDETLAELLHIKLSAGQFISFMQTYEHVCVIGAKIAAQIQRTYLQSPLGVNLRIDNTLYTVIGVAKPWVENAFFNEDINQAVMIPLAGMPLIDKHAKIANAVLLLKPNQSLDATIESIKQQLVEADSALSLYIRSAKQILAGIENQGRILSMLLTVIGGISLLVGGIGIMNVMLVAVNERKQEIGIRKAVGATNQAIGRLFILEALILSLVGGVSGTMLGVGLTFIIAYINHWSFTIALVPLAVGFLVALIAGIFSGFYPARCAAKLEPAVSLRATI